MKLKQLAVALLCGTMIAAPAFAQVSPAPAPAGIGSAPNGNITTTTSSGGSTTTVVPAARGSVGIPGAPAGIGSAPNGNVTTTTNGSYATGTRPGPAMPASSMPATGAMSSTGAMPATSSTAMPAMSMTNINTASASELDKVPQIGKSRAAKIIKMRPYKTTDELVSKKVLPMSVYNKIKTQITAS